MKSFKISYNVLKDTMNGYNIHDIFTWLMIDYFSQEKYYWFFTLQGAPGAPFNPGFCTGKGYLKNMQKPWKFFLKFFC